MRPAFAEVGEHHAGLGTTQDRPAPPNAELDERIRHLQQLRNELTDCIGCGCMSIDRCPLINPDDLLGAQGPGPRRLLAVSSPQS